MEPERIMAEVPDIKQDRPGPYWQKYDQTLQNLRVLVDRERAMFEPDGRMKTGADPAKIRTKYPPPSRLGESVTGPQGQATMKPGTFGRTGR